MADKHPYVVSTKYILDVLNQLRRSFPTRLDADTLKRLSIAPSNEASVLNTIRFLGLIDTDNQRTDLGKRIFSIHDQNAFNTEFTDVIRTAYSGLFDLHGDDAWSVDADKLITYFRETDGTTDRVGREQAKTFQTLAQYAGKITTSTRIQIRTSGKSAGKPRTKTDAKVESTNMPVSAIKAASETPVALRETAKDFGLTVRIEINLPVTDNQDVYDRIFRSIRENLLNG